MSRFSEFRVTPGVPLPEALADFPPVVRAYLRGGFAILARVGDSKANEIVTAAVDSLASGPDIGIAEFAAKIGVSDEEANQVLSAATLLAWIATSRAEESSEIVTTLATAKIIDETIYDAVRRFLEQLTAQVPAIKENLRRSRLGTVVLPSLTEFDYAVDVRLKFSKGKTDLAVPVAVVHLDTDTLDQEIWFQLTKADAERMSKQFQDIIRRLDEAEKWVGEGD